MSGVPDIRWKNQLSRSWYLPCEQPHASNPVRALRGQNLEDGPQRELPETTLVVLRSLSISDAKATLLALKNNWSAGEVCCVCTGGDYVHIGVIEDVKALGAKLEFQALRNRKSLTHHYVEVVRAETTENDPY